MIRSTFFAAALSLVLLSDARADTIQFHNPGSVVSLSDSIKVTGSQLDRVPGAVQIPGSGIFILENTINFTSAELGIPGLTVAVNATGGDPYHDLTGNNGGFGVFARSSTDPFANAGSQDNVAAGQSLALSFNQAIGLQSLMTYNAGHGNHNGGSIIYFVNDGGGAQFLGLPVGGNTVNLGNRVGTFHSFAYVDRQFYVSTVTTASVPEPGLLALLGVGLAAAGVRVRRRK